ncbi:hypothetical protein FJZ26_03370 [Candidatus Parvarchaeota archaeon]|nr:hypothetical protein [Candidatus Parvarchaeota archaeon]
MLDEDKKKNFCRFSQKASMGMWASFFWLLAPLALIGGIAIFAVGILPGGIGLGIGVIGLVFFALLAAFLYFYSEEYYKRLIFCLDLDCLFLRKGVYAHSYTLLPYGNIQDVHAVQTITDSLFGLWTVTVYTATASGAGAAHIGGLERQDAEGFKAAILDRRKRAKNVID